MAEIITAKGQAILVDDDALPLLAQHTWHVTEDGYAATNIDHPTRPGKKTLLMMHRVVLGIPLGLRVDIDHEGGNKLDNRRAKLRVCSHWQNCCNRSAKPGSASGRKGVHKSRSRVNPWAAEIKANGRRVRLGLFQTIDEAAHAYNKAAIALHGDFATLNPVGV